MNVPLRTTLIAAFALLASGAVAEQKAPITVEQLVEKCRYAALSTSKRAELPAAQLAEAEWCQAYMRGVHDMNTIAVGSIDYPTDDYPGYCLDHVVTNITFMARVLTHWARKNRDAAQLPGAAGLVQAMRRTFPC